DLARAKEKRVSESIGASDQSIEVRESPVTNRTTPETRAFGVNISGHLTSVKGVGEAVRAQIRSFTTVSVPLALNDYPDDNSVNADDEFSTFQNDNPYAVNLIHLNADSLKYFVEWKPKKYFQDRYNIGYWAWETPVFPKEWWDRFQLLDEIWVGSDFVM